MDLENKPNMKGTRIGGGYMVVRYGSGGGSGGGILMCSSRDHTCMLWESQNLTEILLLNINYSLA